MPDVAISTMMNALFASGLAVEVEYQPRRSGVVSGIPALIRRPDVTGDFGDVRISQDSRRFEIRVSDLVEVPFGPERDDHVMILSSGVRYRVSDKPIMDQLELFWLIDGWKVDA